ncbi:aminotransferase class IV [Candidatus Roizmanbacteria bacterium]|nr:aminotransferase class IV [Candidatus Roizmanbacteria bacterium]
MDNHFLNDQWVTSDDLKISIFDLSVVRGFGCFDFLRTYNNKPFRLKDHIDRFFTSAKLLGLTVPKTKKEIEKIIIAGLNKNGVYEKNIKIILTGGRTEDGITPDGKQELIVIFTQVVEYPKEYYEKGVKLTTIKAERTIPEAKSLDYTAAVLAMMTAKKLGAEEALYIDEKDRIYEATRCNFFAVIDKKIITPKKGILMGITRKIVIELARKLKISFSERDIYLKEISSFEEAFITASNKQIMPVRLIDKDKVGNGKVGEITKRLIVAFSQLTQGKQG